MNVGLWHKSFHTTCPSLQLFLIGDMFRCIYDRLCCCLNVEMEKDKKKHQNFQGFSWLWQWPPGCPLDGLSPDRGPYIFCCLLSADPRLSATDNPFQGKCFLRRKGLNWFLAQRRAMEGEETASVGWMWLSAVSRRGKFFSSSFTGIGAFKCQESSGLDQQEVFVVERRESQSVLIFIIVNSRDQNSFNILLFCIFSTFSAIFYKTSHWKTRLPLSVIFITYSRSATLIGVSCRFFFDPF